MTAAERQALDVAAVRRWYAGAAASLRQYRDTIDDENVYPVADGDTGTNLLATVESGCTAADAVESTRVGDVVRAFADGALLGAKGNSGLIMSQLLRGLAGALASRQTVTAAQLRKALDAAARAAYASVGQPVEGTILSVVAAAADAARTAKGDVAAVAAAAAAGARAALARTTAQLPALTRAGVVDAGGRGLVLVLDALAVATGALPQREAPHPRRRRRGREVAAETGGSHEVIYLFEADEAASDALRSELVAMGDSVVVAGGNPLFKVHVHLDDPDAAVRAGRRLGRIRDVTVTTLRDEGRCLVEAALVAVTGCPGIVELLRGAGVDAVLDDPCSQHDLGQAIELTQALNVVVLADGPASTGVARRVAKACRDAHVHVVAVRSAVQLLAAVSVHDPERLAADDVPVMTTAAAAVRSRAIRASADPARAARSACDRLLRDGGELVTVIAGAGCPAADVASLLAHLASAHPDVEVHRYDGGQRDSLMLIGVE